LAKACANFYTLLAAKAFHFGYLAGKKVLNAAVFQFLLNLESQKSGLKGSINTDPGPLNAVITTVFVLAKATF